MRLAILICVGALCARPCSAQLIAQAAQESILRLSERDAIARFVASDPRIRALNARIDEIRAAQAERTLWPNPTATYSRESVLGAHDTFLLARYLGPGTVPEALVAADVLDASTSLPPLPPLIAQALANRGDYRASELSIARFEAERAAAARLQIPTPTLTGGLKRSDLGGTAGSGYQFSVDLSIPLFSRGQAATALATAQKACAQAEAESSGSSDRS